MASDGSHLLQRVEKECFIKWVIFNTGLETIFFLFFFSLFLLSIFMI